MHVSIRGRNKTFNKKELEAIVSFYAEYLLGKRLAKNISLYISHENLGEKYAYIFPTDYESSSCREFELTLDRTFTKEYCPKLMAITLAHELIHLKQFAKGELKNHSVDAYKWKGELVDIPESESKYLKTPWEIEAYSREKELYDALLDYLYKSNSGELFSSTE